MKKLIYSFIFYLLMLPFNGIANGCEEENSLLPTAWTSRSSNISPKLRTIRPAKAENINRGREIPNRKSRFFIQQPSLLKGIKPSACPGPPEPASNATEVE